jgi:abortive infection bacteriophage resistance protein
MQNIINPRDIIKQLSKSGLQIGDKNVLSYHIKNFNYNTFIYGYSEPFYSNKTNRIYDHDANSNEMINLYKFDRDMANHILRYILVIEKIINTNVAYEVINHFNLRDKCLLKLDPRFLEHNVLPNLQEIEPKICYSHFIKKLIKYLPTSPVTREYVRKNTCDEIIRWRDCPMDVMCLT